MHESPAANIEEVMWRWERGARPMESDEIDQMVVSWRQHRWAAGTQPFRAALATALLALATRIAPTVAVPNPDPRALAR